MVAIQRIVDRTNSLALGAWLENAESMGEGGPFASSFTQ